MGAELETRTHEVPFLNFLPRVNVDGMVAGEEKLR